MANAAPLAPTLTAPDNNGYVQAANQNFFAWVFNDPGDIQASASLRYKEPAGAWTTLTDVVGAATSHGINGNTFTVDTFIEWQVQTKDSAGAWSPWSASRFVNVLPVIPASTITAPAEDSTITASPLVVAWSIPAGFTQDAYQVYLRYSLPPYDYACNTGIVESSARSVAVPLPAGAGAMTLSAKYRHHGYWSPPNFDYGLTHAILPPEVPLIVLAQVEGEPAVTVSVTCPSASDAGHLDTASVDILRDGVRIAAGLTPNSSFTDYLPGAGERDYRAIAITANGGAADSY